MDKNEYFMDKIKSMNLPSWKTRSSMDKTSTSWTRQVLHGQDKYFMDNTKYYEQDKYFMKLIKYFLWKR